MTDRAPSDEQPISKPQIVGDEVQTVRILQDVPVIFVDGVVSQSFAPGVVKFYFSRVDSDPFLRPEGARNVVNLQVVMPTDSFVRMVAFFEHRLKMMAGSNDVSQATIDAARQFWIDNPNAGRPNA